MAMRFEFIIFSGDHEVRGSGKEVFDDRRLRSGNSHLSAVGSRFSISFLVNEGRCKIQCLLSFEQKQKLRSPTRSDAILFLSTTCTCITLVGQLQVDGFEKLQRFALGLNHGLAGD